MLLTGRRLKQVVEEQMRHVSSRARRPNVTSSDMWQVRIPLAYRCL